MSGYHPEFYNEALRNLQGQTSKEKALELAEKMRIASIKMLEGGKIEVFKPKYLSYALLPLIALQAPFYRLFPWQLISGRVLETTIGPEEHPLKVKLSSSTSVPKKSDEIDLEVEGLDDVLVMKKNRRSVIRHYYDSAVGGELSRRSYHETLDFDTASKFAQVMSEILGKPVKPPNMPKAENEIMYARKGKGIQQPPRIHNSN